MADEPQGHDQGHDLEIEISYPGEDGQPVTISARRIDGPHACPTCSGRWSIYESDHGALLNHDVPICAAFRDLDAASFVRAAQEADTGVNTGERGKA